MILLCVLQKNILKKMENFKENYTKFLSRVIKRESAEK